MVVIMLIVLQLGASGIYAETEFRVSYNPKEACGLRGSWVLMQCNYSLPEAQRFGAGHWYKTNSRNPGVTRFFPPSKDLVKYNIGSKDCEMTINKLEKTDAGIYDFRVTPLASLQMKDSHGVTLTVSDGLLVKLSADVVTEGENVTLTCSASCALDASTTYMWYRNSSDLPFRTTGMNSSLYLHQVSIEDAGRYSCALKGHEEHPSFAVYLRVRSKMGKTLAVVTGCTLAVLAAAFLSSIIICDRRRTKKTKRDSAADIQRAYSNIYATLDPGTMSTDYDTLEDPVLYQ